MERKEIGIVGDLISLSALLLMGIYLAGCGVVFPKGAEIYGGYRTMDEREVNEKTVKQDKSIACWAWGDCEQEGGNHGK